MRTALLESVHTCMSHIAVSRPQGLEGPPEPPCATDVGSETVRRGARGRGARGGRAHIEWVGMYRGRREGIIRPGPSARGRKSCRKIEF